MKFPFQRLWLASGLVAILVAMVTLTPPAPSTLVHAKQDAALPDPAGDSAVANGASLHNPGFDNQDWYEFNARYQSSYPVSSWLPDDDNNQNNDIPESSLQDWRLWFMDGTAIVESDPEKTYKRDGNRGIQMRPYDWGTGHHQLAGLYQVIYDTAPCLVYEFQMYGESYPEQQYWDAVLKVGIDQVGWHPDSKNDPAVHDDFPSTTVWGPVHDYKWPNYGLLTVTAEALDTQIVVYVYADAPGGRYHRVLWDTGSFQETTPGLIPDPDNPPAAGGISSLTVVTSSTSATVNWSTANAALGQVYYRRLPTEPVTPTGTLIYTTYLPLVMVGDTTQEWLSTPLNKSPVTTHSEQISGLLPGSKYEYIIASRGLSGGQCITWVSNKRTFTTAP